MASSTLWTWVWVDSESWWWTGRPGVLVLMGSRRVGNNWATELNILIFMSYKNSCMLDTRPLSDAWFASIFLPFCGLSFHFLGSVWSTKVFKIWWSENCSVVSHSLQLHGLCSSWNSPDKNTRVGSLSLFQGIFPTQGLNPGLPHCRRILYQLSHKGSPCFDEVQFKYLFVWLLLVSYLRNHHPIQD